MSNDLPPWEAVYQQTRRWLVAGVFEAIVHDLREVLRLAQGRTAAPTAHGVRLEVIKLPQTKRGFVLLPRRWVVERSFACDTGMLSHPLRIPVWADAALTDAAVAAPVRPLE